MLESSPETDGVLVNPIENSGVDTAATPAADQGVEKSPSDLVFEALGMTDKEKSPDSEPDQKEPAAPTEEAAKTAEAEVKTEAELGELTKEELSKYSPKTQRRMQQLLDQRLETHRENESLKPKAAQFDTLSEFAASNRLSMTQVGESVELAALVHNNPDEALNRLLPVVQQLMQTTGRTLPPDMQERVRLGYIGEQEAQRLTRAESDARRASERLQQTEQERQQAEQQTALRNLQDSAKATAETWEAAKRAKDPDWQLRADRVGELIKLEVYEKGFPKTPADINRMLDEIDAKVIKAYSRFTPKPQAVRPVTGSAATQATSEPKTSQEAALRALGF